MLDIPSHLRPINVTGVSPLFPGWTGPDTDPQSSALDHGNWFDPEPFIGKRGHKYFPHAGRLCTASLTMIADAMGVDAADLGDENVGMIVGTNFGVHPTLREIEATVMEHGYTCLSPSSAPNFSVNIPGSLAGIKSKITGLNITLTDSFTAAASALALASVTIHAGTVNQCLAGGVDDTSSQAGCNEATAAKDGACLFLLDNGSDAASLGTMRFLQGRFATALARNHKAFDHLVEMLGLETKTHEVSVFAANSDVAQDIADLLKRASPRLATQRASNPATIQFGGLSPLYQLAQNVKTQTSALVLSVGPTRAFVAIQFTPNTLHTQGATQ